MGRGGGEAMRHRGVRFVFRVEMTLFHTVSPPRGSFLVDYFVLLCSKEVRRLRGHLLRDSEKHSELLRFARFSLRASMCVYLFAFLFYCCRLTRC